MESLSFWPLSCFVIVLVNSPLISGVFVGHDFTDSVHFTVLQRPLSGSPQPN